MKLDPPETLHRNDNQCKNSQSFDGWVNASQTCLVFKNIYVNVESTLQFIAFLVTNSAQVLYNQFQPEEQARYEAFFKFNLALHKFLMAYISKELW